MRKDFKALGWFMKESGVRVFFSSLLLLWGDDVRLNIKIQSIKALAMCLVLQAWVWVLS